MAPAQPCTGTAHLLISSLEKALVPGGSVVVDVEFQCSEFLAAPPSPARLRSCWVGLLWL